MPLNAAWHRDHPLARTASRSDRLRWHVEHARACGCRPIPASLQRELERPARGATPRGSAGAARRRKIG